MRVLIICCVTFYILDGKNKLHRRSKSSDGIQFSTTQASENNFDTRSEGGDFKHKIRHSFREIIGGRRRRGSSGEAKVRSALAETGVVPGVVRPVPPPLPELPPPSLSGYNVADGGSDDQQSRRQHMRLEGLRINSPAIPPGVGNYDVDIEVDRYDRLVQTADGSMMLPAGLTQSQTLYIPSMGGFDDVGE